MASGTEDFIITTVTIKFVVRSIAKDHISIAAALYLMVSAVTINQIVIAAAEDSGNPRSAFQGVVPHISLGASR